MSIDAVFAVEIVSEGEAFTVTNQDGQFVSDDVAIKVNELVELIKHGYNRNR